MDRLLDEWGIPKDTSTGRGQLTGLREARRRQKGLGAPHNPPLSCHPKQRMVNIVPLTLEQIVEEIRHWPPEKVGELVDRLTEDLHNVNPEVEEAWKQEARRRLAEIENGTAQPVDGEEVSARVGKIVGR